MNGEKIIFNFGWNELLLVMMKVRKLVLFLVFLIICIGIMLIEWYIRKIKMIFELGKGFFCNYVM